MRLDLRATLTEVRAHRSRVSNRPLVTLTFQATCQPELPPLTITYAVDNPALEFLRATAQRLGVDLLDHGDSAEEYAADLEDNRATWRVVTLEVKPEVQAGFDRLVVRRVKAPG